ncbi:MAG: Uncharacterized protein MJ1480, partial [uncultured Pseudonocardia sp.]
LRRPRRPCRAAAAAPARRGGRLRVHVLGGVQREAAGVARPPDRRADARGEGRGQEDPVGRRSGGRAHRRLARDGATGPRRLRRRPVRRQRPGHARHRVRTVRHVARRRPGEGVGCAARARAPHPGDQHDPRGGLHQGCCRLRRAHRGRHARDGGGGQAVRAGRLRARRRPAARRPHRRDRGAAGDARPAARRRLRDHGRDDAALHRDGEHPAGVDPAGERGHQPGDGHQARRPRQRPGDGHHHRHRPVPRAAGPRAGPGEL